jgi:hypothetical protein
MNDFFKKNWLNTLSVTIGIVGILIAIYAYTRTKKERIPTFYVDSVRTQIIDAKQVSSAPIKVIRNDGTEIKSDLNAIRFYFWNDGNETIRVENILENIILTIDDPDAEILDFKILKISRIVTGLQLNKITIDDSFHFGLKISCVILEKNDGFSGQIIYAGKPNADLNINGIIEGYGPIKSKIKQKEENSFSNNLLQGSTVLGMFFFIMFIIFATRKCHNTYIVKNRNNKGSYLLIKKILSIVFIYFIGTLLCVTLIWIVVMHIIPSLMQSVPNSIF